MTLAAMLSKVKIVSLSEIQKNPSKALNGKIIHIVKNGKEIGIFMSKEEFEDFIEETLGLKPEFKKQLDETLQKNKKTKATPMKF